MWTIVTLLLFLFVVFYYVDYHTNAVIAKSKEKPNSPAAVNSNSSVIFDLVDVLVHNTPKTCLRKAGDITPKVEVHK